jgi:hypothetical protein
MNFLKEKTSWSNAELIVIKVCIATAYILIGAYFHTFFSTHYIPVLIVFGITVVWGLYLYITKMKNTNQQ